MIPQSTTLAERLEFYEWALEELQNPKGFYLCHVYARKFSVELREFSIKNIKKLFPELYEMRDKEIPYHNILWYTKDERIEALQKAIIEVKRKIE